MGTVKKESGEAAAGGGREKRYEAGKQRVVDIIESANATMVDGGYSQLTLRRVAARAGMPLRHLQYYFPTKEELLRALCESVCANYIARCDALASRKHSSPMVRFRSCIDFLINDNRDPYSNTLFYELWALSCHDEHANKLLDRLYLHYRGYIQGLIEHLRPDLDAQVIRSRAVQIVALIEGLTLFIGRNRPHHMVLRGVGKDAAKSILDLALAK